MCLAVERSIPLEGKYNLKWIRPGRISCHDTRCCAMSFFDVNVSNPQAAISCLDDHICRLFQSELVETTCIPAEHCHLFFSVSFRMGIGWWFVNSFGKSGVIWLRRLGSEIGRYVSVRHELISKPNMSMLRNSSDRPAKTSFFGWGLMCWTFRFCKRPWGQLWPTTTRISSPWKIQRQFHRLCG